MARVQPDADVQIDPRIKGALSDRWDWLAHQSTGSPAVIRKVIDDLEDAGRAEDRIRQDYTGRYPIELLQNAHDASADGGVVGAVRFVLTSSALLVANEGVPFTHERVLSLVRQGSSEKVRRAPHRHTIGYKGVGFTAVFEICDQPQVLSKTISFSFDRRKAARHVEKALTAVPKVVPSRYFPFHPVQLEEYADDADEIERLWDLGASSIIRLPLRRGRSVQEIHQHLVETITPEILLFMPAVDDLELTVGGETTSWKRVVGKNVGPGRVMTLLGSSGDSTAWLVGQASFRPPKGVLADLDDPLWEGVGTLNVGAALPWKRGHVDSAGALHPLHVYFPTDDKFGRRVLVHGDFRIDSSRRRVESKGPGGEVSRLVARRVAKLVGDLAESVASDGILLLSALAQVGPSDGFGAEMSIVLDEHLANRRIVRPASGGKPRKARDLLRLDSGLGGGWDRSFIEFVRPTGDLVFPGDDVEPAGRLLEALGSEAIDAKDLAARVAHPASDSAYEALLKHVGQWIESLVYPDRHRALEVLQSRPLLRDTEGAWRNSEEVVLLSTDTPELPRKLRRTVLLPPRGRVGRKLVEELGVVSMSSALALDILLDAIEEDGFGSSDQEARQVFKFMERIWNGHRELLSSRRSRLTSVPVRARTFRGKSGKWVPAGMVYFSSAWIGDRVLEDLYGGLGLPEFLLETPPAQPGKRRPRMEFFRTLGVAEIPRMRSYQGVDYASSYSRDWAQPLFRYQDWRSEPEVAEAFACPSDHPATPRLVHIEVLDRLDDVIRSDNPAGIVRALTKLETATGPSAKVRCTHSEHRGKKNWSTAPGYQRWLLQTEPWVPVKNDPTGANVRVPGQSWTDVPERLEWLQVPQAMFAGERVRRLGVVSAEHPRPEAIEAALRDLFSTSPTPGSLRDETIRTADWLITQLESRLKKGSTDHPSGAPPLLAHARGDKRMWSTEPLVPDLPGLENMTDLLALPRGDWRGLQRVYGLKRASEAVKVRVRRGGLTSELSQVTGSSSTQLLALLTKLGSDPRPIAFRLARLREFPVQRLTLEIRYEQTEWSASPTHHLRIKRDARDRLAGADLYWNIVSSPSAIELGRALAAYLDEPTHEATIAYFLRDAEDLVSVHDVSDDDLVAAQDVLRKQRRRKSVEDVDDWEDEEPASVDEPMQDEAPEPSDDDIDDAVPGPEGDEAPVEAVGDRHLKAVDPFGQVSRRSGAPRSVTEGSLADPGEAYIDPSGVEFGSPVPGREAPSSRRAQSESGEPSRTAGPRGPSSFRTSNPETEQRAIELVIRYAVDVLRARVIDVQTQNKGWDLEFHFDDGTWAPIEVKGSAAQGNFVVTRNELRRARAYPNYQLYFVTNLEKGQEHRMIRFPHIGAVADDDLSAVAWEVTWGSLQHEVIPVIVQAEEAGE